MDIFPFYTSLQATLFWYWKLGSLLHFLILAYILIFFREKTVSFIKGVCDIYVGEISKPSVIFMGLERWGKFIYIF
jgi:hypothetical protein